MKITFKLLFISLFMQITATPKEWWFKLLFTYYEDSVIEGIHEYFGIKFKVFTDWHHPFIYGIQIDRNILFVDFGTFGKLPKYLQKQILNN